MSKMYNLKRFKEEFDSTKKKLSLKDLSKDYNSNSVPREDLISRDSNMPPT